MIVMIFRVGMVGPERESRTKVTVMVKVSVPPSIFDR